MYRVTVSYHAPQCPQCDHPTRFRKVTDFGIPETFTVAWACDGCICSSIVEVFGLYTTTPQPGHCLACGQWVIPRLDSCHRCDLLQTPIVEQIHARAGLPPEPARIIELCDEGLFALALCATNSLLADDPKDAAALQVKSEIYSRLGHSELAVPLLRQAYTLTGDDERLNDLGPAEAPHLRALAMSPSNAGLRWNLMVNLFHRGRTTAALQIMGELQIVVGDEPEIDADVRMGALAGVECSQETIVKLIAPE